MKTVKGLQALIAMSQDLPNVGWIFVEKGFDKTSAEALMDAVFYIQENKDEGFYGRENYATWLESPTFQDILEVRKKNMKNPSTQDVARAAIYYLEMDDFLE